MNHRLRRASGRLALAVSGVVLALLAAEGAYRMTRAGALSPTTNPAYVEHHERLGWAYRPGARERHATSEFDVAVAIHSRGFRGPEWRLEVPKHGPRVLVLGDSQAFGWGVEFEQSFSARLQTLEPGWDVLNAAVSGYGTDQQALLLDELLSAVQPDVVVCAFCDNDLFENRSRSTYGRAKPWFERQGRELVLHGVPVPEPWIESVSFLARALRKSAFERLLDTRRADPEEEWVLVADIYRRMAARLGSVPLVIVSDEPRLAALAREEPTMRHVDLRAAFRDVRGSLRFSIDGHWTALAHELVATAVDAALRPLVP